MSELNPCPLRSENGNCGPMGGFCQHDTDLCKAITRAYEHGHFCGMQDAFSRRAQPDNAPLTLDDLQGMDGDKIKIHYIGHCEGFYEDVIAPYYGDKEQYIQRYNGMLHACDLPLQYYGVEWTATAYRRKPETKEELARNDASDE